MKKVAKAIVVSVLAWQLRRLRAKNQFKIIGIAGSIGKTSTKLAIASVLSQKYKVKFQNGNYNDLVTVPLIFFGQPLPSLFNPFGWLKVFMINETLIRKPYPFDIVITELGTDGPGQIARFSKYLKLDIGVITAISPEHMENFQDLDAVAGEELEIAKLSGQLFVNTDLCAEKYLKTVATKYTAYSDDAVQFINDKVISKTQIFSASAALAVGRELGLNKQQLEAGIRSIKPVSGRMQLLKGINNSTIIDDTYNSSPEAVKEALNTLYSFNSAQKIAVLGSMNELGKFSADAHSDIGNYCDPKELHTLITIGHDANKYLAAVAEKKGCIVEKFDDPYEAGEYLKEIVEQNAVILAKGSQNGVFAEEIIKYILADSKDRTHLVRQSPQWLKIKNKQFNRKNEV